ncbi:cytochrome c553 [Limnobacter thiooxidans]|uniref:C-type cytochrome n=2 Tax=Limnobacter thiooxidans TaxID=131080 RepID=A0AA86MER1_9BURK|nr:cytochrome c553 [Limnobacter thiooxidans]BET27296.1 c-type cytochrome [Limnobacter thiooxidans]
MQIFGLLYNFLMGLTMLTKLTTPNKSMMLKLSSMFAALTFSMSVAYAAGPAEVFKPDLAKGNEIMQQCVACHGADGNASAPIYPKIAGQHAEYLYKQLSNFKAGKNGEKPLRENAIMAAFAAGLSDEDMKNVSAYLASQKQTLSAAKNKDTLALGEKIYRGGIADKKIPACAGCHSPTGSGIPAQYPRLGGQHAQYTESQLVAFRDGVRNNSEQMSVIAAKMSDKEMKAVSDYIAGLR